MTRLCPQHKKPLAVELIIENGISEEDYYEPPTAHIELCCREIVDPNNFCAFRTNLTEMADQYAIAKWIEERY